MFKMEKCHVCKIPTGYKFQMLQNLSILLCNHPGLSIVYILRLCPFQCSTVESVRKHILKTAKHKGERVYSCDLCTEFGADTAAEFARHLGEEHSDVLATPHEVQSHVKGHFVL